MPTISRLSQRRAASVKAFLVETYHVDGRRLSVIGFGEEQLKNKEDPLADENRRVQIVNTGSATVAEGKPAPAEPQRRKQHRCRRRTRRLRPKQPLPLSSLTRRVLRRRGSAA